MNPKYLAIILGLMLIITGSTSANNIMPMKGQSKGKTLYVGGSGPGNYTRIQDAIDNASNRDTVFVYNDSSPYFENIVVDKSIQLVGEDRNSIVIDGQENGDVVYISANKVNISNFIIQNSGEDWFNDAGIQVHANNTIIENNIVQNNNLGILLKEYSGGNNLIKHNDILANNNTGIRSIFNPHNNTIIENKIHSNGIYGISIGFSDNNNIFHNEIISNLYKGIVISESKYTKIFVNNISDSWEEGIWLVNRNSDNNVIRNNICQNSIGIKVSNQSENNTIYLNNFFDNAQHAFDETVNIWDKSYPSGGNYWDDYSYIDNFSGPNQDVSGPDGIGDLPYLIPGGDNEDKYPLMEPYGMTNLTFSSLTAGLFKSRITIKNIWNNTAFNVQWNLTLDGGIILLGRYSSGTIPKPLLPGEETSVSSRMVFGLGRIQITISAWADNAPVISITSPGFLLLFFVIPYIVIPYQ